MKLLEIQSQQETLAKKIANTQKIQDERFQQQKALTEDLEKEICTVIKEIGFPLNNFQLLLGMVLYAKELLDNDTDEKSKQQILMFMDKYKKFEQAHLQPKKRKPRTPRNISKTEDDSE